MKETCCNQKSELCSEIKASERSSKCEKKFNVQSSTILVLQSHCNVYKIVTESQ